MVSHVLGKSKFENLCDLVVCCVGDFQTWFEIFFWVNVVIVDSFFCLLTFLGHFWDIFLLLLLHVVLDVGL